MKNGDLQPIELSKLHLDPENPRHEPIADEPEIIARLYKAERVLALAKSIAAIGPSPIELMAVVPHPTIKGHFVVAEGNRRLCALKLLRDPAKAPTAAARRALELAQANAKQVPSKITIAYFDSKKAARQWVKLRHEGEQGGAGTKKWTAKQIVRYNQADESALVNPNAQALALVEYSRSGGLVSDDEATELARRLTTLTRYLGNPVFRHTLGLADKTSLKIDVEQDEFDKGVSRFLRDALPGADGTEPKVNSRTKAPDWKAYARELTEQGVAPTTRLATPVDAVPKVKNKKPSVRHEPPEDNRPKIVRSDFKVSIKNPVLKRIFAELRTIDPDEFSFSSGYLIRAFVEQTAYLYARQKGIGDKGALHDVIKRCAEHLEANGAERSEVKPLKEMSSDKDSRLSPDGLGAWVHGSMIPTGAELKRRWDTLSPGFKRMLDAM